jgi:hypothetical protein
MVCRKSLPTADLESRLTQAITGVQSGKYKSLYKAAQVLDITRSTLTRCVNGGLSRS